jgi:uncharacterized membrane protein
MGLLLMLATFASLILLIQHISTMLQAPNIVAAAGAELLDVVGVEPSDEKTSENDQSQAGQGWPATLNEAEGYPVRLNETGYIQYIDPEYVLTLAGEKDIVIRLLRKPGHFVRFGEVVALVWPAGSGELRLDGRVDEQIRHAFQVGNQRTPTQDIEYAVNQLVEVAVRAMSPAINDPFTAMTCLDYLGNGLALFVQQGEEIPHIYDRDGKLRLVYEPVAFNELLDVAFDMLRHASCDNASVLLRMLDTIEAIGQKDQSPEVHEELLRHVSLIQAECQAGALIEGDRQAVRLRCESLRAGLGQ